MSRPEGDKGANRRAAANAAVPDRERPQGGSHGQRRTVERVQTGVRMEKRMLLLLKALAGVLGLTFGDLLEGIVLHALDGKTPFSAATMQKIEGLRAVYHLDLRAEDSHLLVEKPATGRRGGSRPPGRRPGGAGRAR